MAYNGKAKRIKNALLLLLATIEYDAGGGNEAAFAQILDNNRNVFEGYPNAQVLPGDVTDTRQTVAQTDRMITYMIRLRIPLEDTDASQSATYDQMYDLTDLVLDCFDESDQGSTLADGIGTIGTYFMNATRGDWKIVPAGNGVILLCDINLEITYSKDL